MPLVLSKAQALALPISSVMRELIKALLRACWYLGITTANRRKRTATVIISSASVKA